MKVALSEIRIVLARLLWSFDVRLEDESDRWDWGEQTTSNFWVSVHVDVPITSNSPNADSKPEQKASQSSLAPYQKDLSRTGLVVLVARSIILSQRKLVQDD